MRDVLDLRVPFLRAMPLATSLVLRLKAVSARVVWTTSGRAYEAARTARAAAWAPDEYEALALAVELHRATGRDFARWCERKLIGHGVVVDARIAMAGAEGIVPYVEKRASVRLGRGQRESVVVGAVRRPGVQAHSTLTFGELLERVSAELVDVEVHAVDAPASAPGTWTAM